MCDLVLPCHDEAGALPALLAEVPPGFSVIVVDNGSRDATADVARAHGARVVSEPRLGVRRGGAGGARGRDGGVRRRDGRRRLLRPGRSSGPAGRRSSRAAATWRSAAAARSPRGSGPGTPGPATPWWCGGCVGRSASLCTTSLPMRVCRRQALLDLDVRDRRFGYPLELLPQGDPCRVAARGAATSPTARAPQAPSRRSAAACEVRRAPLATSGRSWRDDGGRGLREGAGGRQGTGARTREDAARCHVGMEAAARLAAASLLDTLGRVPSGVPRVPPRARRRPRRSRRARTPCDALARAGPSTASAATGSASDSRTLTPTPRAPARRSRSAWTPPRSRRTTCAPSRGRPRRAMPCSARPTTAAGGCSH